MLFATCNDAVSARSVRTVHDGSPPSRLTTKILVWVLGLCFVSLTALSAPAATSAPVTDPPLRVGVAYGDELVWKSDLELGRSLDAARDLGVDWIRVDLAWADIQPDSPKLYKWERFDRVFGAAKARNLRVLAVLAYTPVWARSPDCPNQSCPPADPAKFADFARQAAERYAPQGLRNWEVWNEPNFTVFWYPRPNAADYTALLKQTTAALRRVDPTMKVIMGGLAAMVDRGGNIPQIDFLADVAALGGVKVVDAIAFHPYTFPFLSSDDSAWRTSWDTIHGTRTMPDGQFYSLRAVLNAYQLWGTPIWITEYGAPTGGPGDISDGTAASMSRPTTHVTEERQAHIAADSVSMAMKDPSLGAFIWYSEKDRSFNVDDTENFFGLRRADGAKKPAFNAFRDALLQDRPLRSRG